MFDCASVELVEEKPRITVPWRNSDTIETVWVLGPILPLIKQSSIIWNGWHKLLRFLLCVSRMPNGQSYRLWLGKQSVWPWFTLKFPFHSSQQINSSLVNIHMLLILGSYNLNACINMKLHLKCRAVLDLENNIVNVLLNA